MIALIKDLDGTAYESVVVAVCRDGRKSKIIALTPDYAALKAVNYWGNSFSDGMRRRVFETDLSEEGFVNSGKWRGLDCIVNDKKLLRSLQKGKEISADVLQGCGSLQAVHGIKEWNEVKNQADIEVLLNISLSFHDGVVSKIAETDNGLLVEIKCWSCVIVLNFINVIEPRVSAIDWRNNCIIDAGVEFLDGGILWNVGSFCYYENDGEPECFIKAEKLSWKIIID